jgi:hypothetical protein
LRLLTLLLGLAVAGLLIVLPQQFNVNILPAFVKLWPNTEGQRQLANIIFLAVPAAAVLGGLLGLFVPGIAALLLLLAGLGWFGILLSIPGGFTLMGAAPGAVAVLGAVTAYVAAELAASRRRDELRDERATRRGRRLRDIDEDADEDDYEDLPRQGEPALKGAARVEPVAERSTRPQRPRYDIPLTLEDTAHNQEDEIDVVPPRRGPVEPQVLPKAAPRGSAAAQRRGSGRQAARVAEREQSVSERDAYDADYDEYGRPRPRQSFPWAAVVGGVVLVVIGLAAGWLYLEPQQGAGTEATVVSTGGATATAGTTGGAALSTVATGTTFADPFAYCLAVGTIDYVDGRYTGTMVTPEIAQALRMPIDSSRDRVVWRCVGGEVLGCSSFAWPRCGIVPTAKELVEFCRLFPEVPRLIAPQGPWSCVAGKPKLPDDATWPVDARGFAVGAWINISASSKAPAASPITNAPVTADGTTVLQ